MYVLLGINHFPAKNKIVLLSSASAIKSEGTKPADEFMTPGFSHSSMFHICLNFAQRNRLTRGFLRKRRRGFVRLPVTIPNFRVDTDAGKVSNITVEVFDQSKRSLPVGDK